MHPKRARWLHDASRGLTMITASGNSKRDNHDERYRRWISHSKIKHGGCGCDKKEHCCITILGGCIWFRFHARADSKALVSLPDPSSCSSYRQLLHWAIQGMATEYMMFACIDALIVISNAITIKNEKKKAVPIIPERIVTMLIEEVLKAYLQERYRHDTSSAVVCFLARQIQGHFILLNILQPHQQQKGSCFVLLTACFQEEHQNEANSSSFCKTDWRYPFVQRLQENWTNGILGTDSSAPGSKDSSYDQLQFLSRYLPRLCVGLQAYALAVNLLQDPVFAQYRLEQIQPQRLLAVKSWIVDSQWLVESWTLGLGGGGATSRHASRFFLQSTISCMANCLLEEYETRMMSSSSSSLQSANETGSLQDNEDMGRALALVGMQVESYCHDAPDASSTALLAMMLLERAEVSLAFGLFSRMSRVAMALRYVGMVLHVRRNDELKQQARKAFHVYHSMKQDFAPHQQKWPVTASRLLSMKRNLNDIVDILFVVQDALSALILPDNGLDLCTNRLKEELRSAYQLIGLMADVLLAKSSPRDLDLARRLLNTQDVISGVVVSSND